MPIISILSLLIGLSGCVHSNLKSVKPSLLRSVKSCDNCREVASSRVYRDTPIQIREKNSSEVKMGLEKLPLRMYISYVTEDDFHLCLMSIYQKLLDDENQGYSCDLYYKEAADRIEALLVSDQYEFILSQEPKFIISIYPQKITFKFYVENERVVQKLLRTHFEEYAHKLRAVKYIVVESDKK